MSQSNGPDGEKKSSFKWGAKRGVGGTNKNVQFYESFTLEGIEYRLLDCAYFWVGGQGETAIGKLVRMFETSLGEKKVKVVWFLRPIEICEFLGDYVPRWNELFIACGDGKAVCNINDAEAVLTKCSVICKSRDPRNPPPARDEWRPHSYVFSRTFDTGLRIISKVFPDAIAGIGVENFFNKGKDKQPLKGLNSSAAGNSRASQMKSFHRESGSTKLGKQDNRDGNLNSRTSLTKKGFFLEDNHVSVKTDITSRGLKTKTREFCASGSSVDPKPSRKRKLILNTPETDDSDDSGPQPGEKKGIEDPPLVEKVPSQNIDRGSWYKKLVSSLTNNLVSSDGSGPQPGKGKRVEDPPLVEKVPTQSIALQDTGSWYKKLPFEDELKLAIEEGRFLLIENLEPSSTSMEVEDLCRKAFNENVDAKMIPSSLMSSPHNGRALVIFKTRNAADSAMSLLTKKCLMLPNQRILVGSKKVPVEIEKCKSFTGHLSRLDRSLMTTEKRKAVATSHCAQPNHIENPMALEWLALQTKSESKWKNLSEKQAKEIDVARSKNHQGTEGKEQCKKSL